MRPLEILEERPIVDRDRGLARQRLEEPDPLVVRIEWSAVENFQHPSHEPLRDERGSVVRDDPFRRQHIGTGDMLMVGYEVGYGEEVPLLGHPAG